MGQVEIVRYKPDAEAVFSARTAKKQESTDLAFFGSLAKDHKSRNVP
jgi:hypothetical protein